MFIDSLQSSLDEEFAWTDDFVNPYEDYLFSAGFQNKMKKIIRMSNYNYSSLGSVRIRKTTLAILIAAVISLLITGCAFAVHYYVQWNESGNSANGTKEITFETQTNALNQSNTPFHPVIPEGFSIDRRSTDEGYYSIECSNIEGKQIIFTIRNNIDNLSVEIDSISAEMKEVYITGYKGYTYYKNDLNAVFWIDSSYFYELQGTCGSDVLISMLKELEIQY